MIILAHRGVWKTECDKNTLKSLKKAFCCGYGIETDLRDYCGKIVISHDIADDKSPLFDDLLQIYISSGTGLPLALNVKADGLQKHAKELLQKYKIDNYFFFDMSIPELVVYKKMDLIYFTRQSDIEKEPILYNSSNGIWIDGFYEEWINCKEIQRHLANGKYVSVISPEIHKKDSQGLWRMLKNIDGRKLMLCTDKPGEAEEYFNGKQNKSYLV